MARHIARPLNAERMREHAGDAAQLLKVLANEKRLMILCLLVDAERSVGELNALLDLSQSALSQHTIRSSMLAHVGRSINRASVTAIAQSAAVCWSVDTRDWSQALLTASRYAWNAGNWLMVSS